MTALIGVMHEGRRARVADGRARLPPAPTLLDAAEATALTAVLGEIPSAAFVVWDDGRIAIANLPGQAARDRDPGFVESRLRASLGSPGGAFRVTRIPAPGSRGHFLAVAVEGLADPTARIAGASRSLGLTPRQTQVLALLAHGRSNKSIAGELGCAESTVEIHVTALLCKSGCGSRCEVVARLWSGTFAVAAQRDTSCGL